MRKFGRFVQVFGVKMVRALSGRGRDALWEILEAPEV